VYPELPAVRESVDSSNIRLSEARSEPGQPESDNEAQSEAEVLPLPNDKHRLDNTVDGASDNGRHGFLGGRANDLCRGEIAMLRGKRHDMIDQLRDLDSAAITLLEPLAPKTLTADDLRTIVEGLNGSRQALWSRRAETLSSLFDSYGIDSTVFIKPELAVPAMVATDIESIEEVRQGAWRPDEILLMANLAQFAFGVMSTQGREQSERQDWLLALDLHFPTQFVAGTVIQRSSQNIIPVGYTELRTETFDLALELRTQLFISLLETRLEDSHDDPFELLSTTFTTSSPLHLRDIIKSKRDGVSSQILTKGWRLPGLHVEDTLQPLVQRIVLLGEQLVSSESEPKSSQAKEIRALFPWDRAVLRCMTWIRERYDELQWRISSNGGVREITDSLRRGIVDAQNSPQKRDIAYASFGPAGKRVNGLESGPEEPGTKRHSLLYLTQLSKQEPNLHLESAYENDTVPTDRSNNEVPPMENEIEDSDMIIIESRPRDNVPEVARNHRTASASPRTQARHSTKKPSAKFAEHQPCASRVSPISEDQANVNSGTSQITDESPHRRRRAKMPQIDPLDRRSVEARREAAKVRRDKEARRRKERQAMAEAKKEFEAAKAKLEAAQRNRQAMKDDEGPNGSEEADGKEKRTANQGNGHDEESDSPAATWNDYKNSVPRKAPRAPRQERRAWTDDESNELIRLVGLKGAAYSAIEKYAADHDVLPGRTQGDLKDRAKRMKFKMLSS